MKYIVEMDLGAMRYIPKFIKIGSGVLLGAWNFRHIEQGNFISLNLFF
jgi:hypothetical protein